MINIYILWILNFLISKMRWGLEYIYHGRVWIGLRYTSNSKSHSFVIFVSPNNDVSFKITIELVIDNWPRLKIPHPSYLFRNFFWMIEKYDWCELKLK